MITEIQKRKFFQRVKSMTNEQFWTMLNAGLAKAYETSEQHWNEAIFIELPPRYRKKVLERVEVIRRDWDRIGECEIEETEVVK